MTIFGQALSKYYSKIFSPLDNIPFRQVLPLNGIILGFHQIQPPQSNDSLRFNKDLEISDIKFEEILKYLKKEGYVIISIDEVKYYKNKKGKFAVITFDDGYLDNYKYAYPLLKKFNAPFTLYISNSFAHQKQIMWWYLLESLIMKNDVVYFKNNITDYIIQFTTDNIKSKKSTFYSIRNSILNNYNCPWIPQFDYLFKDFNLDNEIDQLKTIDWKLLKELAKDPLVTIGSHTRNHLNLNLLNQIELEEEIVNSKMELQEKLDIEINHFSFPYGIVPNEAFGLSLIRTHFKTAVTTDFGYINSTTSNLYLPRIFIPGNYPDQFLRNYFNGLELIRRKLLRL